MKTGQSIRLLDGHIGYIIKIGESHSKVRISKNVRSIRTSTIAKAENIAYDYFQVNTKRIAQVANSSRIPLKTLVYNSANADSHISEKLLEKALAAFTQFSKLIGNSHKLGIFEAAKLAHKVIMPILKKGFEVHGFIEGGNRVLILKRSGERLKAYKLPIKTMEVSHGEKRKEIKQGC